jgi:hypothetical protein
MGDYTKAFRCPPKKNPRTRHMLRQAKNSIIRTFTRSELNDEYKFPRTDPNDDPNDVGSRHGERDAQPCVPTVNMMIGRQECRGKGFSLEINQAIRRTILLTR